jgi:hypothetical protein
MALKSCHIFGGRASGFLAVTLSFCKLALANLGATEIVSTLDGEWEKLAMVTGFHSITEPKSGFHVRVIEANGRGTVAINPITLYFVVTNDSSAGDLQQHIWRLPLTVGRVEDVSIISSGVRIAAALEAMPDANIKAKQLNLLVRYKLKDGILSDTITVEREAVRPED